MKRGLEPLSGSHQRLLDILEVSGPLTRAELAARSDLPRPTVTGLARELLRRGEVSERESADVRRGTGRPPKVLAVARDPRLVGVLTWAGDAVHASLATYAGDLVARTTREIPAVGHDLAQAFEPAAELIGAALRDAGGPRGRLTDVVLSMPHPRNPTDFTVGLAQRLGRLGDVVGGQAVDRGIAWEAHP